MLSLVAVARSIGPENGTEIRGWMLKPSSVLSTSMSAQSEGRTAQFGFASATRTPVIWLSSGVVWRLLGKGWPAEAAKAAVGRTSATTASSAARLRMRKRRPLSKDW